jgi:fumarate reductase (CoM/CoB) subunit A
MTMALVEEVRRRDIPHMDKVMITRLLTSDSRCVGAFGIEMRTGEYIVFKAKATILATGGAGRVYKVTSNPEEATGDGYAIAYDIGAELMDMEQFQFHPTGMIFSRIRQGDSRHGDRERRGRTVEEHQWREVHGAVQSIPDGALPQGCRREEHIL